MDPVLSSGGRAGSEGAGRDIGSGADSDVALVPAVPVESSSGASDVDVMRRAIVADEDRHGVWLQLGEYGPLPKRIALGIASSWRRARPVTFGGDRHFQARIFPVSGGGSGRKVMVVRSEKLFAVAVSYPRLEELESALSLATK